LSSPRDLVGVKAEMGALKGPGGRIGGKDIRVRYGVRVDDAWRLPMALVDEAPREVKATETRGRRGEKRYKVAFVPVWVTVHISSDVGAGAYRGTLRVSAGGMEEKRIPVEVEVMDWSLPADACAYHMFVSVYQSPEAVAYYYGVPLWSEEHWRLLEKSWALLGYLGNRFIAVPVINRTQFGNDEGMVRWIRKKDGGWDVDFSVCDRYLEIARRYCKLDVISFIVWNGIPGWKEGKRLGGWNQAEPDKPTYFTVIEEKTGKKEAMRFPRYGIEECKRIWEPFCRAVRERLKKWKVRKRWKGYKIGRSCVVLGITAEGGIHKDVEEMFKELLPEAAGWHWMAHNRQSRNRLAAFDEYMYVLSIPAPGEKRPWVWWKPSSQGTLIVGSQRIYDPDQNTLMMRTMAERYMFLGDQGCGRMCLDYWKVSVPGKKKRIQLFNRWPLSTSSQRRPKLTELAASGPHGAVSTPRIEMLREGFQEAEARAYVEKALVEGKIGGELAKRCRRILEKRRHYCRITHWTHRAPIARFTYGRGWQARSAELYRLAAEVARAIEGSR